MDTPPKITKVTKAGSYYGKDFSVEVWQPDGGRAFVHSVQIEGWPAFRGLDLDDAPTIEEAVEIGFRFAVDQLDN